MYYRSFIIRRLHSWAGIVPLAFFMVEHFFTNSFALRGPEAYDAAINFLHQIPYLLVVEIILIMLPIAVHGGYGLWIVFSGSYNLRRYPRGGNWMYFLQRLTGIIMFIFILYHFYTLRLADLLFGTEVSFVTLSQQMQNPWIAALYLIGLFAAIWHFANGLVTFSIHWGLVTGPQARTGAYVIATIVGAAFAYTGINFFLAFV